MQIAITRIIVHWDLKKLEAKYLKNVFKQADVAIVEKIGN